jgi:uncharacterized 2Fe-2S/4Fe-4S cluster protein (DUF4445 family)
MAECRITFHPQNRSVSVKKGTSLLEAVAQAHININNLCGGDGICGRCRMIIRDGEITGKVSAKLTRKEIRQGYVLACMSQVETDLIVEIPKETWARERARADEDASRFQDFDQKVPLLGDLSPSPLVAKIYLALEPPTLADNRADHQRISDAVRKKLKYRSLQMGLKVIKSLPEVLRDHDYKITATVGLRRDIAEIMDIEGGNTQDHSYMAVVDIGTTTLVAHLIDSNHTKTIDAEACFNSQGIFGREVTGRMISAEKMGTDALQKLLIDDINRLITRLAEANRIKLKDITAVICSGNTTMEHFLVGLPTENIRRNPYVPVSVDLPPLRAAEVGIQINPRGLLYSLPGISGWVGSDITAGILATGIAEGDELSLLVDIGTNGEIVMGNGEWLVACSASAGPALEGAGIDCGMRAERGAVEKVYVEDGILGFKTIGELLPNGICGSGIIDLVSVLLEMRLLDRSGRLTDSGDPRVVSVNGVKRFVLADGQDTESGNAIYITESDIENVITAKAAIFAATKILADRLDIDFSQICHLYIAGAFGNHLGIENAIRIGLIPDVPRERISFVGNTSIKGAKIVALYKEAYYKVRRIVERTTYYDLMGEEDYIEQFRKALFLPHTDIELFKRNESWQKA